MQLTITGPKKKKVVVDDEPVKKKKKIVVDDEPVKKKKKKVEEEPVKKKKKRVAEDEPTKKPKNAIAEIKLTKISKLSSKAEARSIIGKNVEQIHQLLEAKNNDVVIPMIYKNMIQGLVDLLPLAETQVRKTKGARGVYQVNTLISSIRELLNDVQASQDRGMLGHALIEQVIQPAFTDVAMEIVKEFASISADAKSGMEAREYDRFKVSLIASRKVVADSLTNMFRDIREQTIQYLER